MRFHGLDEFPWQRSFSLEEIVQPGVILLCRPGIEDDWTSREIPIQNIVFVVTAGAVSIQTKSSARRMLAQVLLQAPYGISVRVMNQVAADEAAPVPLCEGDVQSRPVGGHFHRIVNVIVFNDIVSSERHIRILTASHAHADVSSVVDQVVRDDGILSRKQEDANCPVVVSTAMMDVIIG